jgi:hypothetical protein
MQYWCRPIDFINLLRTDDWHLITSPFIRCPVRVTHPQTLWAIFMTLSFLGFALARGRNNSVIGRRAIIHKPLCTLKDQHNSTRQLGIRALLDSTIFPDTRTPQPIPPRYMTLEDVHALVAGLIANVFKEDATGEEGELDCLDVDVGFVAMPRVRPYYVGDEKAKDTVEKEEQEDDDNDHHDQLDEEYPVTALAACLSFNLRPGLPLGVGPGKHTN